MVQQGIDWGRQWKASLGSDDPALLTQPCWAHMGPNQSSSTMGVCPSSPWIHTSVPINTQNDLYISVSHSRDKWYKTIKAYINFKDLLPTVWKRIMKNPCAPWQQILFSTCPSFDVAEFTLTWGYGHCGSEDRGSLKCQHSGTTCAQLYQSSNVA